MPLYRIHRIKEGPRESFRWAAHTGGLAIAKPKDYLCDEEVKAGNPYDTWKQMSASERPLRPGDLLEQLTDTSAEPAVCGPMWIAKYVGFEPAEWLAPDSGVNEVTNVIETASRSANQAEGRPI